ncbi:MAG: STAS domain-containing protein [Candidatus Viridilinea halotolerans]|uniref:STAS domain-containing protein n=1 Tax=Candidatus Viridilinea halotolerans TaxID=2491704 RepID=A0A426U4T4_9CHLR|nr:MAG: STAS domain-containing protein [Candidatus Viridilinea halotolerans]
MPITQRNVTLLMLVIFNTGILGVTGIFWMTNARTLLPIAVVGSFLLIALLFAYWHGWEPARFLASAFLAIVIAGTINDPLLTFSVGTTPLLAVSAAALIATPLWAVGSTLIVAMALLVRMAAPDADFFVADFVIYLLNSSAIVLTRVVAETATQHAEAQATAAEHARAQSEIQAAELAQRSAELQTQNEQQAQLLDLVATLETPAVDMADGVLLAPIVGHLDTRRASQLTARLLQDVSERRTRLVILDIAGVNNVDTAVAQAILHTVQAVHLLGCDVIVTGISAAVATTMTHLGIDLSGITTARTPQEALGQEIGSRK